MRIFQFLKCVLQKIIESAEDPSKTSRFSILERHIQLLKELDQALNEVDIARQQLKKKSRQLNSRTRNALTKAKHALLTDHEDLARIALIRKRMIMLEVEKLNQKILAVDKDKERLSIIKHRLTMHLDDYRTKQDILASCHTAKEAHFAVDKVMKGISDDYEALNQNQTLELTKKSVDDLHVRSEDIDELLQSGLLEDLSCPGAGPGNISKPHRSQIDIEIDKEVEVLKKEIKGNRGDWNNSK
jgi:phage shock protein A